MIWRTTVQGLRFKPAEGLEVIATGRVTTYPGLVEVPDRHRRAGAGRHRRADGAARGAQEEARRRGPVRRGARSALPFLPRVIGIVTSPTGRRDPRHAARASPSGFPARVLRVAGARAGRDLRRRGGGGDQRLQCAAAGRRDPATGCADRRPRRRQPRGPVGLQRGDRRARRWPRAQSRSSPRSATRPTGR